MVNSIIILSLIGLVVLGVAHLADIYKKDNLLAASLIALIVFGFAFYAYRGYVDYAGQDIYRGEGIVLNVYPSEKDGVFRRVVIDVPDLDDIAIHNLSELEYYKAGEPAVGSICRVVRLPYYMIFFTILAYDYPACSAPATGAE